jgi:hypothetical protein
MNGEIPSIAGLQQRMIVLACEDDVAEVQVLVCLRKSIDIMPT